jgi:hypothetical protein
MKVYQAAQAIANLFVISRWRRVLFHFQPSAHASNKAAKSQRPRLWVKRCMLQVVGEGKAKELRHAQQRDNTQRAKRFIVRLRYKLFKIARQVHSLPRYIRVLHDGVLPRHAWESPEVVNVIELGMARAD